MWYNKDITVKAKEDFCMYKLVEALKYKAVRNLRGGVGTVYCSKDLKEGKVCISFMRLAPGVSIGKHLHEDNEEVYIVIKGGLATINGRKVKMDICRIGEEHDCVNNTDEEIIILSIKIFR